jgi:hypothetical protein
MIYQEVDATTANGTIIFGGGEGIDTKTFFVKSGALQGTLNISLALDGNASTYYDIAAGDEQYNLTVKGKGFSFCVCVLAAYSGCVV